MFTQVNSLLTGEKIMNDEVQINVVDNSAQTMRKETIEYFLREYEALKNIQKLISIIIENVIQRIEKNQITLEELAIFLRIMSDSKNQSQNSIIELMKIAHGELLNKEGQKFKLREKKSEAEIKLEKEVTELLKQHRDKNKNE